MTRDNNRVGRPHEKRKYTVQSLRYTSIGLGRLYYQASYLDQTSCPFPILGHQHTRVLQTSPRVCAGRELTPTEVPATRGKSKRVQSCSSGVKRGARIGLMPSGSWKLLGAMFAWVCSTGGLSKWTCRHPLPLVLGAFFHVKEIERMPGLSFLHYFGPFLEHLCVSASLQAYP
jgi:hypothetical protein